MLCWANFPCSSGGTTIAQLRAAQPNVLIVLTDDQGWGDVEAHGNELLTTPAMNRLRAEGANLQNFYVSPVCAPTRASLLTGRYHLRCGVHGVTRAHETMHAQEMTIAEVFRAAGYMTGCFGKWHNGAHYPHDPQGQGFDEFLGFCAGHWHNYFDTRLQHNQGWQQTQGFMIDALTDAALSFIESNTDQPFLCYVSWNTPHSPFQVPDKYFDKFKRLDLHDHLACVYGMCENIDDNLGRLLTALDENELTENTIVVFLSDNGPNTDRYNGGMRGRKGSVHEGGVRVPCFIRWPGWIAGGLNIEPIAAHIDLLPTLAALAEIDIPSSVELDGVSLKPLLNGNHTNWPARRIFTHHFQRGGRIELFPASVRDQRYRAVIQRDGWQLFDLSQDPCEQHDIQVAHPTKLQSLTEAYDAWFADVTSGGFAPIPTEIGHEIASIVALPAHEAFARTR